MTTPDDDDATPTAAELIADSHEDTRRWQWLAFSVVAGVLVWRLSPVLTPFVIALFFGYLGDPLVDRLERARMSRTFAVFLVFFVMTAIVALVLLFLVPLLGDQVSHFIEQMPAYAAWLRDTALPWVNRRTHMDFSPYIDPQQLSVMLRQHWEEAGGLASSLLGGLSRSGLRLIEILTTVCLVPVLAFYFLRDWDVLVARIDMLLPRNIQPTIARLARESDATLGGFLRGQMLVMVSLGVIYTFGLWMAGLDLALLIGLIAGLVSFVPYLGVIIGVSASLIAVLVQYGDWTHVLYVVAVFTIGPLLESFVLIPRLVGDKIGMHPVGVIFALMAGGQLFGFLGVLLALPASAIAMVLLRYGHERYTSSKLYAGSVASVAEPAALGVVKVQSPQTGDARGESPPIP
ncbi:MAG: AI-2E family transporter [Lysobacteraceae bacterium]